MTCLNPMTCPANNLHTGCHERQRCWEAATCAAQLVAVRRGCNDLFLSADAALSKLPQHMVQIRTLRVAEHTLLRAPKVTKWHVAGACGCLRGAAACLRGAEARAHRQC